MKDFRDLKVWEKGHELTLACYAATAEFAKQELFGLGRRAKPICWLEEGVTHVTMPARLLGLTKHRGLNAEC